MLQKWHNVLSLFLELIGLSFSLENFLFDDFASTAELKLKFDAREFTENGDIHQSLILSAILGDLDDSFGKVFFSNFAFNDVKRCFRWVLFWGETNTY